MTRANVAKAALVYFAAIFPAAPQDLVWPNRAQGLEVEAFRSVSNLYAPAIYQGEGYAYLKNYFVKHRPDAFDLVFYRTYHCTEDRENKQGLGLGRIIGQPGDHLLIDGDEVIVNGTKLAQTPPASGDPLLPTELKDYFSTRKLLYESTPTGRRYGVVVPNKPFVLRRVKLDLVVPEGKYFILHDLRTRLTDGRYLIEEDADACSSTNTRSHFVSAARILHRPTIIVSSPYPDRTDAPIE